MTWIRVGVQEEQDLPRDRLTERELAELRTMLTEREQHLGRARVAEERIQLMLLTARDRRGLRGVLKADPETGAIADGEVAGG